MVTYHRSGNQRKAILFSSDVRITRNLDLIIVPAIHIRKRRGNAGMCWQWQDNLLYITTSMCRPKGKSAAAHKQRQAKQTIDEARRSRGDSHLCSGACSSLSPTRRYGSSWAWFLLQATSMKGKYYVKCSIILDCYIKRRSRIAPG